MIIIFLFLLFIHGFIHLMGFAKAFNYGNITQIKRYISPKAGMLWLFACVIITAAAVLLIMDNNLWLIFAFIGAILSQILIVSTWGDSKWGSIANLIILIVAVLSFTSLEFEDRFVKDVKENLKRTSTLKAEILTEADLADIPLPVQKYLRYSGAVNKPKVRNFRIVFDGEMREKGKDYFKFRSVQYNFFDNPTRLFFMKAKMFGLVVPGYHKYFDGKASMNIRLFGLIPIIEKSGDLMNRTETVTLFNDMCLMAPPTLIDKRITWEAVNDTTVKAIFTNQGISVSAILYFNSKGQLVNFLSDDRTEINLMKKLPFTTPVYEYKNIDGRNIMTRGETVWEYPDGKFTYGKFNLKEVEYNLSEIEI